MTLQGEYSPSLRAQQSNVIASGTKQDHCEFSKATSLRVAKQRHCERSEVASLRAQRSKKKPTFSLK